MPAIPPREWSPELLVDRVDVIRSIKNQDASGVSRPTPQTIRTQVSCTIKDKDSLLKLGIASQGEADAWIMFSEDQGLKTDDLLQPVSPSIGPRLRVTDYRYVTFMGLYRAICKRVA